MSNAEPGRVSNACVLNSAVSSSNSRSPGLTKPRSVAAPPLALEAASASVPLSSDCRNATAPAWLSKS